MKGMCLSYGNQENLKMCFTMFYDLLELENYFNKVRKQTVSTGSWI